MSQASYRGSTQHLTPHNDKSWSWESLRLMRSRSITGIFFPAFAAEWPGSRGRGCPNENVPEEIQASTGFSLQRHSSLWEHRHPQEEILQTEHYSLGESLVGDPKADTARRTLTS